MDYPPKTWPQSPRIVVQCAPRASNGPNHLGLSQNLWVQVLRPIKALGMALYNGLMMVRQSDHRDDMQVEWTGLHHLLGRVNVAPKR